MWHAHLARDFTGGTPVPLSKLNQYPAFALLDKALWRSLNYAIPNTLARLTCKF